MTFNLLTIGLAVPGVVPLLGATAASIAP